VENKIKDQISKSKIAVSLSGGVLNRFFAALRMTNGNLVGWAVPMRKSGAGSLRLGRGDSGIRLRCSGPTEGEFQGV